MTFALSVPLVVVGFNAIGHAVDWWRIYQSLYGKVRMIHHHQISF